MMILIMIMNSLRTCPLGAARDIEYKSKVTNGERNRQVDLICQGNLRKIFIMLLSISRMQRIERTKT
jgi:hypothetical protein